MRALAVTGVHRAKIVTELPTIAEAGVPGYEFDNWYGLWAPAARRLRSSGKSTKK